MGRLVILQGFYTIPGILFFVRDLFNNVPMDKGMVNAFIWPYAQWPVMKGYALQMLDPVIEIAQPVLKIFQ